MTTDEIQIIEKFITKINPVIEFYEMQAIVKMQYELYQHIMLPTHVINIDGPHIRKEKDND